MFEGPKVVGQGVKMQISNLKIKLQSAADVLGLRDALQV